MEYDDKTIEEKIAHAMQHYDAGDEKEALREFMAIYEATADREILMAIYTAYVEPNEERFAKMFRKNEELLQHYTYVYGDWPLYRRHRIAWADNDGIFYFIEEEARFEEWVLSKVSLEEMEEETVLCWNVMSMQPVMESLQKCRQAWSINGRMIPVYLGFDEKYADIFLQLYDVEGLIRTGRIVFFFGDGARREYFAMDRIFMPKLVITDEARRMAIQREMTETEAAKHERYEENKAAVDAYYETNSADIVAHIVGGKPRVMAMMTRFSTAPHARNLIAAFRAIGCEARLLTEEDDISELNAFVLMQELMDFKPDLFIWTDHYRWERGDFFPEGLVMVTWIQDPMAYTMDPENPGRLLPRDVLMNHLFSFRELVDIYKDRTVIKAPIPSDEAVYRPYKMTEEEKEKYGADICFVCHQSDVEGYITKIADGAGDEEFAGVIRNICHAYVEQAHRGVILYSNEDFRDYIRKVTRGETFLTDEQIGYLTYEMHMWLNQRIYRQVLADWLIEAGYVDIKLWGAGWSYDRKYDAYACGWAENGETLSKILQASKIVIGNNIMTTAAARAWETMLSGGFYISNYIPPEDDFTDIRSFVEVERDVVFFRDKKELLEKVAFYLSHEDERQAMAQRGREVALRVMTFRRLAERMIKEIPSILEKQGATRG